MKRLLFLSLLVFLLDQALKQVVVRGMEPGQTIPVINGVFHITYVRNPGAAFGLLANRQLFFVVVTVLVISLILFYVAPRIRKKGWPVLLPFALVLGGAVGNLADRLRLGYVVDYLDFRVWPVFNLADSAIVVGVGLLFWLVLREGEDGQTGWL